MYLTAYNNDKKARDDQVRCLQNVSTKFEGSQLNKEASNCIFDLKADYPTFYLSGMKRRAPKDIQEALDKIYNNIRTKSDVDKAIEIVKADKLKLIQYYKEMYWNFDPSFTQVRLRS